MTAGLHPSPTLSPLAGSFLPRARAKLLSLPRWYRAALACGGGALAALALPPFHLVLVLVVSFGVLLWLIEEDIHLLDAAIAGWAFGFGFFLAGLYWIGISFFVDAERFGWFAVPAVVGLSAFLALFTGAAAAAASLLESHGLGRVFALALAWTGAEWLRGHVLTGFPWNLIGYVWTFSDAMIQPAAVFGAYGLSFLTVVLAALPALAGYRLAERSTWFYPGITVVAIAGLWLLGTARLVLADPSPASGQLRVVQASVEQTAKWRPDERQRILDRYIELSQRGGLTGIDLVIWPETALPFAVASDAPLPVPLLAAVPPGGHLVTGAIRTAGSGAASPQYWNSLIAIDESGTIVASYDKVHLVPLGEYMPFRALLPFKKLTEGSVDFSSGSGPRLVQLPGLPAFSPLICYEAIFPGDVTEGSGRPVWLLNVSNDAWFGRSTGPYQHFAMARLRAVEEGVPLIRAANTGISGVIDAYGRVTARLDLNQAGVIDSSLPAALDRPTPFARVGNGNVAALVLVGWLVALMSRPPRPHLTSEP